MRLNSRAWFLISLALFLAAGWVWHLGNEKQQRSVPVQAPAGPVRPVPEAAPIPPLKSSASSPSVGAKPASTASVEADARFKFRVSNTRESISELIRSESALLLRNALINTTNGVGLEIPSHLKATSSSSSFIVQSRGNSTAEFQRQLISAGVRIVSYIPNNAFLVLGEPGQAESLRALPDVRAVQSFEPYFKLADPLLENAVKGMELVDGTRLNVLVFPGKGAEARAALSSLGVEVESIESSPFGERWTIVPPVGWVEVAKLDAIQSLELWHPRAYVNDLSRERLGVSYDTVTNDNYLGLTGEGITVSVNDSGVDAGHPELDGRVVTADTNTLSLVDAAGHGTHVSAIIAGNGSKSDSITNLLGTVSGASFRGKAPKAQIYSLFLGGRRGGLNVVPTITDSYLQQTVAKTNALVSNNSWGYVGDNDYSSSSASFDAAVRDALPGVGGSQPVLFVFAAGNEGEGNDNGLGGLPQSIGSPATAKNVITVGAVESLRKLTNTAISTNINGTNVVITTNQIYFAGSDSNDEVADYSSRGNVGIGTEGEFGRFKPDVVAPGSFVVSARSRQWKLSPQSLNFSAVKALNDSVAPHYRFESGTSMAAPAITGTLALMQEFLEKRLGRRPSPALLKALLINGARSLGTKYDLSPSSTINYQGWGVANLSNSIPVFYGRFGSGTNAPGALGSPDIADVPHVFIDQGSASLGTNDSGGLVGHALASGQVESFELKPTLEGKVLPLRVTLVWTDPPGNPVAGVKLVNDLDLVVSNTVTKQVFYGNNIPSGSDFTVGVGTNSPARSDLVNNVENVFLPAPLGENYVISVVARRVNVNAVTSNTNGIVQDYALVVSAGDGDVTNAFRFSRHAPLLAAEMPALISVTNGVALFNQRVGANNPLSSDRIGQKSQWNFYVFTNLTSTASSAAGLTNGSNVAFVTFFPPNLASPRQTEADIDLYVSTNPALTNLDPAVIAASSKSTNRSGTQLVFFTNAPLGEVFYVGVKAEDQQGAEFGLYGISSDKPFSSIGPDGKQTVNGYPLNVPIPDGSPEKPGAAVIIGIAIEPMVIRQVQVENFIQHESIGDLVGNLSHNDQFVVLNNHYSYADPTVTNHFFRYDDSGRGDFRSGARPTDGPGSLTSFNGSEASGVWLLNMVDNSPSHEGRNLRMSISIEPMPKDRSVYTGTILANQFDDIVVDVPTDGEKLIVNVAQMSGPLDVFVRYKFLPTITEYDKTASLKPPSGTLTYTVNDQPPLRPGRYFITLFNPNAVPVSYRTIITVDRNPRAEIANVFSSADTPQAIVDDAVTTSSIFVNDNRQLVAARASVRIDHPRAADLVLHLVSPEGTRILLSENRGGLETGGFGSGNLTNLVYAGFSEDTNLIVGPIKSVLPPYTTVATTTTNSISGFEAAEARRYNKGEVVDGWTVEDIFRSTNSATGVITRSLPFVTTDAVLAVEGTNIFNLGRARISRLLNTRPGQQYSMRFSYRAASAGTINAQVVVDGTLVGFIGGDRNRWQRKQVDFIAARASTEIEISPAFNNPGILLDAFELVETSGAIYYLPEESLGALEGQSAFGNWKLEVLDNRTGPAAVIPSLLSWQLQLVLSRPTLPVVSLQDGIPVAGEVRGGETSYFMVDVPRDVVVATNLLFSAGDLVLTYNQDALPTGLLAGDVIVDELREGGESLLLSTNVTPLLRPGQRYYLGVSNFDPATTNQFSLAVNLGYGPSSLIQPIVLTNGVSHSATILPSNIIDYYQFQVSPNAYNSTFEVLPVNGNVDLVVRKAMPVRDPLPTPTRYDYASGEPGLAREEIIVVTNSVPVALSPGTWYLGVYNLDTNAVSYAIRATEALSPFTITPLTNGVPLKATAIKTPVLTNFFSFNVPEPGTDQSVRFDLYGLSANADFMLKRDDLFDIDKPDIRTNAGPNGSAVFTFSTSTSSSVAGNWFLAVANPAVSNVNFTIRATILTNSAPPITELTNAVAITNYLFGAGTERRLDFYRYLVPASAKYIDIDLAPISGEVDLLVSKGPFLPQTNRADYVSQRPGGDREFLRIARGSAPVSLEAGEWFIAAYNKSDFPAIYSLRATSVLEGKVKPIAPDIAYQEFGALRTLNYYQISTSTNHFNAVFQVSASEGVSGQLVMYLRKGLPLPDSTNANYVSTPGSGVSASISIGRTSSPVPLDAGEWFLAVENKGPLPVAYDLFYSLFTGSNSGTNGIVFQVIDSPTTSCIRWRSIVGSSYLVLGSTNRSGSGPWEVAAPLFTADSGQSELCLPKPNPYVDFIVRESAGGVTASSLVISPALTITSDSFCLGWSSVVGASYHVEGKPDLFSNSWVSISPTTVASGTNSTYCIPFANTNRFFRIVSP